MARINSLNILLQGGTSGAKDLLSEMYGKVIDGVSKQLVSTRIKNMDLSGDPASGTVEAKRFVNATSNAYGTARAAGKGDSLSALPVVIPINTDKEIVEELEEKDVSLYGVEGVLARRAQNHIQIMAAELDRAFFTEAKTAGVSLTIPQGMTNIEDILEFGIQSVETIQNAYVDGVPRGLLKLVCNPAYYGQIRNRLDTLTRVNVDTATEEFFAFHGVETFSSIHLPANTNFMVMINGAVAQPVKSDPYTAEKIPLADAVALELFYYYGTKAVMPDLIAWAKDRRASMKVILPSGAIAECNNEVVIDQWKKAGYKEVAPVQQEGKKAETKKKSKSE